MPQIISSDLQWLRLVYSSNPDVEEVTDFYDAYYSKHKFVKNIYTQNYKYLL